MKKYLLVAASVLMLLIGLLRGFGGVVLITDSTVVSPELSSMRVNFAAWSLIIVCCLLIFAGINLIIRRNKVAWTMSWIAIAIFIVGGVANGFALFGQPLGSGQLINISVSVVVGCLLLGGKGGLKEIAAKRNHL